MLLAAIWVFLVWRDGGYESGLRATGAFLARLHSLCRSGFYALGVLMAVSFMYRGLLLSRQVYLMTGVVACGLMVLTRLLFRAVQRDLGSQGVAVERVAVVGTGPQARQVAERLEAEGGTTRVVGFLHWKEEGEGNEGEEQGGELAGRPVLGDIRRIRELHAAARFDTLVLSQDLLEPGKAGAGGNGSVLEVLNFCEEAGVALYMVPAAFDVAVTRQEVGSFCERPLIRLRDASVRPTYAVVKRIIDVFLAALGLVLGLPLWILIAVVIKLTSPGPVFFSQVRAGRHGKPFRVYKFRSMVPDAEAQLTRLVDLDKLAVPGFKIKNDPRVTPFGRFLRRTGLDEIPQLFNVLKGEMSLVGPRPELPELVARYSPEERRRLKAKPGITGYQQVKARGIPLAAGVKYDLIYLKHQSLLLDLYILLRTVLVVLRGEGVSC